VRLIGTADVLDRAEALVRERLGKWIFTSDERALPNVVVEKLTALGKTIATAESCTGGFVANQLTNVPGS
jgi:nicotinamide-nucleotide amidase